MYSLRCKYFTNLTFYICKRHKHAKTHWSRLRKNDKASDRALTNFDDFYGSVFGGKWDPIRKALLRNHKYVALVNNYGDSDETMALLENLGAHNMRRLFEAQKEFIKNSNPSDSIPTFSSNSADKQDAHIRSFMSQVNHMEIQEIYQSRGEKMDTPEVLDTGGAIIGDTQKLKEETVEEKKTCNAMKASLAASLSEAEMDTSRVIESNQGMNSGALWTFLPATRIKGRDDWLPESTHYQYYSSAGDFPLTIEEDNFEFPEHLQVYSYENDNTSSFPLPKQGSTGALNYYMMDGASILPVLALGLKPHDRVLDLCASPGGKSLAVLQTLLPDLIVANDKSLSRVNRIYNVFREYLYDFDTSNKWRERIMISNADGCHYKDREGFDKVLIDVPCTIDRISVKSNDNNIFKSSRSKERLKLPDLQSDLLSNALSLCRVGGTVVYSTCSLSPIQNDGVVHLGLKKAFETSGIKATIKLFKDSLLPIQVLFRVGRGQTGARYGHLITPHISANFGPAYFAKLVRTQ